MAFPKSLNELCRPSYIYFIISFIGLIMIAIQNIGNSQRYCLGNFSCNVPSTIAVFVFKLVYILFLVCLINLIILVKKFILVIIIKL